MAEIFTLLNQAYPYGDKVIHVVYVQEENFNM